MVGQQLTCGYQGRVLMLRTFNNLWKHTDYKVQSRPIIMGIFLGINVLLGANLLAKVFIGLEGTSLPAIIIFFGVSILMTAAYRIWPSVKWINHTIVIFCYCLLEGMFLTKPINFHAIHFWFVLLIVVAFIVEGMRVAQVWFLILVLTFFINAQYIEYLFNGSYPIEVKKSAYLVTHLIFLFGIFAASALLYRLLGDAYAGMKQKTEELRKLQEEISAQKATLERYQNTLLDLTRKEAALTGTMEDINRAIATAARRTLDISQVSIWFFDAAGESLTRQLFCTPRGLTDDKLVITRQEYPSYFNALMTKPFISATQAAIHPDTAEFANTFIHEEKIRSILDCPILLDREVLGVISCEQTHTERAWSLEDALFVQSLSDFVALGSQNERIKNLVKQIREQNFDLVEKNHEIGALNEELTMVNDQLAELNKNLEDAVRKRTSELETQNRQLTEYAFINSHLLRAPLARVLGLSQLVAREVSTAHERELLHALEASAHELDQIIRKISELLYAGNNFSRQDINDIIHRQLDQRETPTG